MVHGFLNQTRVQRQMDKQARIQKFLAESEKSIQQRLGRSRYGEDHMSHRRSSSADPILMNVHDSHKAANEGPFSNAFDVQPANESAFQLQVCIFSTFRCFFRATPILYVKLKALRDLRALIVASLDRDGNGSPTPTQQFINSQGRAAAENLRLKPS